MKLIILVTVTTIFSPFARAEFQIADMGFPTFGYYLFTEPSTLEGQDAFIFSLRSTTDDKAVKISPCSYPVQSLNAQISQIEDTNIRTDIDFLINRGSKDSSTSIDVFYPEFKSLLERTSPKCKVKTLKELVDEAAPKAG